MIYIYIISDNNKHFETPIKEYQKRLAKKVQLKIIKPSKKDSISEIVLDETEIMLQLIKKQSGYKILLSIWGNQFDSIRFWKIIEQKQAILWDICFIIGWAYGLDEEKIWEYINTKFSLSAMTFPHGLALLLLYEQIYRGECIKIWKKYHH